MKNRTFSRVVLFALCLVGLAAVASFLASPRVAGQDRRRARQDVERVLEGFDELSLDPAAMRGEARKGGGLTLATSRGTFEMSLEPFDVRTPGYRAVAVGEGGVVTELPRTPSHAFRGTVKGMEGTQVRLILDGQKVEGIIVTPEEIFFVEPERDFSPAAGPKDFVFYAESNLKQPTPGECGTTLAQRVGAEASHAGHDAETFSAAKGTTPEGVFAPKPEAEVATEADVEFFKANASDANVTNNDILNILTQVDAIYDAQLGIKIRVNFQRVWALADVNGDPYTLTAAGSALDEFRTKYDGSFGTQPLPARDLTHMFTGKDFDGSTIGIAYISAICDSPGFSYGISQSRFSVNTTQRVALTAHEMGHNFSASHPDQENPVPSSCSPSIMNSFIQNTTNFCVFSRDQITNHVAGTGGSCLTRLVQPGCIYTLSNPSQFFSADGGIGSIGVITSGGNCVWAEAEGADWIDTNGSGVGSGGGTFTVAANTGGPRQAVIDIAGQKLTVKQAASPACGGGAQIGFGQTISAALAPTDCRSGQPDRANAHIDLYTFTARAGQRVRIEMAAAIKPSGTTPPPEALDTFMYLFGPDGSVVAFNDDINPGTDTDSRIPLNGFLTLPQTGVYTVEATSFDNDDDGAYTLKLSDNSATNSVAFSTSALSVNEGVGGDGLGTDGTGFRVVTVQRSGSDVSGTATVDYATTNGSADKQKDYTQSLGTLVFGPGEASKTFIVFVVDDAFSESPETLSVTLSNPLGTTLGSPSNATLTINSNDAASGPSPVRAESFNTSFYVREQYLDFLSREPDSSGFAFWKNEIDSCPTEQCREVKRINVSAAFFLSIEFQETGYLVYRAYKTAYGDATSPNVTGTVPVIRLQEFLPDTQRIGQGVQVGVGNWQQQLDANKNAYLLEFVLRQRFLDAYPLSMTPAQFVDKLNANADGALSQSERDQLVAELSAAADAAAGRASVLRKVAEDADLRRSELNRAFVLMQYYGYLRRNPDDPQDTDFRGWKFWLDKLNQFGGNFVQAEMVKAFITSTEYIDRFGNRQ
jgi:hypothetical protein